MTRTWLVCLSWMAAAAPVLAALAPGAVAPPFELPAALAGKSFTYSLRDALRQGPVVVYFYPSAYTNGCNLQAHAFSEKQPRFAAAGASIIGVSLDSIERLTDFSADPDYCAGKIAVASDVDARVAKSFGLVIRDATPGRKDSRGQEIGHGFAERTTFIVTADGRIHATVDGLSPQANVDKALGIVRALAPALR
jgi:peroxiredoxin